MKSGRASPSTQVQTISVGSYLFSPWPEHYLQLLHRPARTDSDLDTAADSAENGLISTAVVKMRSTERLFGGLD